MKNIASSAIALSLVIYIIEVSLFNDIRFLIYNLVITLAVFALYNFRFIEAVRNSKIPVLFSAFMVFFAYILNMDFGYQKYVIIFLKSFEAILIVSTFNTMFSFSKVITGFKKIGLLSVLADMVFLTYRYFDVISKELESMEKALISKGFKRGRGFWEWNTMKILGYLVGSLFIRSAERSERVYNAMLSRGYSGKLVLKEEESLFASNLIFIAGILIPPAILLFIEKVY